MARRDHIPALDAARLASAISQLGALKLTPSSKQLIENMLRAAANPDAESPVVIMRTLEPARRENAEATAAVVGRHTQDLVARGARELSALSDDEWDRLVDEAARE